MNKTIAVLSGDGIGIEVTDQATKILEKVASKFNHNFEFKTAYIGGSAYDKYQTHLPAQTLEICKETDAILLGAIGGPVEAQTDLKWKDAEKNSLLNPRKKVH